MAGSCTAVVGGQHRQAQLLSHPGDATGLPLTAVVTAANVPDVAMLEAVVEDVPPVRTPSGRRRTRPDKLDADKGHDSKANRAYVRRRGITARIARRGIESSTRLGRCRWRDRVAIESRHKPNMGARGPAMRAAVLPTDLAMIPRRRLVPRPDARPIPACLRLEAARAAGALSVVHAFGLFSWLRQISARQVHEPSRMSAPRAGSASRRGRIRRSGTARGHPGLDFPIIWV
jgi:hypothetical protein